METTKNEAPSAVRESWMRRAELSVLRVDSRTVTVPLEILEDMNAAEAEALVGLARRAADHDSPKPDERALFRRFCQSTDFLREVFEEMGMPYKRARYIVRDKWDRQGLVEWGCTWRCAWLTDKGRERGERLHGTCRDDSVGPGMPGHSPGGAAGLFEWVARDLRERYGSTEE